MFERFPITEKMHIHSLDGELRDANPIKTKVSWSVVHRVKKVLITAATI